MKFYLIALFCFTSVLAKAQTDYCADIIKNGSELTESTTFKSKVLWISNKSNVCTFKAITNKLNGISLVFTNYSSELSYTLKGLYIKFEDGTFYRDPSLKLSVDYHKETPDWEYTGILMLDKDLLERFELHKIQSINFGYSGDMIMPEVNKDKLIQYLICTNTLK